MTLTEFLLARLSDDEHFAHLADTGSLWHRVGHRDACDWWGDMPGSCTCGAVGRALAEVEAKRRIVERFAQAERLVQANAEKHAEASRGGLDNQEQIVALRTHGWELAGRRDGLRFAVEEIAQPYADHPDFDDEWRV